MSIELYRALTTKNRAKGSFILVTGYCKFAEDCTNADIGNILSLAGHSKFAL